MFDLFNPAPSLISHKEVGCELKIVETDSPINAPRLGSQNYRLLMYFLTTKRINVFSEAKRELGIGYLNSRVSDLIHKHNIDVKSKMITVDGVDCKEYYLEASEIARIKEKYKLQF